jgi:hypothetical protein
VNFRWAPFLKVKGDFLVGCGVDLGARQALYEIDRSRYPRLEFGNVGLGYPENV